MLNRDQVPDPARDRHTSPMMGKATVVRSLILSVLDLYLAVISHVLWPTFFNNPYSYPPAHPQYVIAFDDYNPHSFHTNQFFNMPLIDPVTTAAGGDKTQEWQNKLVGKKLGDAHDEVVSDPFRQYLAIYTYSLQTFAKTDLPKQARVIEPGSIVTKDFNPDR